MSTQYTLVRSISPEKIEQYREKIARHPYLTFRYRRYLPDIPALYIVVDESFQFLYVGIASNLRDRWREHHRAPQMGLEYRIYWLQVDSAFDRRKFEAQFIQRLNPLWNRTPIVLQEG